MEGILGNIVMLAYDAEYLQMSRASPARMWGLMAGRWITSAQPREVPGLVLIGTFAEDPNELYPGSDGPYLYRNELCLPRAFTTRSAALAADRRRGAWRQLCAAPFWSPQHTVLIDAGADPDPALLDRFERAFAFDPSGVPEAVRVAGLPVGPPQPLHSGAAEFPAPIRALDPPQPVWNGMHLDLPPDAGDAWLVLAETCALYPGWTARVDGQEVAIHRANGAATAL